MSETTPELSERLPVFVEAGPEGGHRRSVGGVTVLERVLRGLVREGVVEVWVAAAPIELRVGLPLGTASGFGLWIGMGVKLALTKAGL